MLGRWQTGTWKFGFIKQVDKDRMTAVRDLEGLPFERYTLRQREAGKFYGFLVQTSLFRRGRLKPINLYKHGYA